MSDEEPEEKPFVAEIAKQGRAACKKCKQNCPKDELRLAKLQYNPFGAGKMKAWHHVNCLFEVLMKQRPTTKRIEDPEDIEGFEDLEDEHKDMILKKIKELNEFFEKKHGVKPKAKVVTPKKDIDVKKKEPKVKDEDDEKSASSSKQSSVASSVTQPEKDHSLHKDNSFRGFRILVADITNVSSYLEKTKLVSKMFTEGTDGTGFKGDIVLWCRLLLPGFVKRIYNLQSKQLIKLFSRIFGTNQEEMLEDLEKGDVSDTVQKFFELSKSFKPAKKSTLLLKEVDEFLEELSTLTKEDEQVNHLKMFASKCTGNELKVVIRLIKHDLRMNAGAKHILDGVHPDAYSAYQSSRDIGSVIKRCLSDKGKQSKASIRLMTPVLPMLAEACKSVEQAMKKCPNGMFSEIKYDGERVQVHKQGSEFKYFSRSLKPVMPHKVAHFKDHIPSAFPQGTDLILDSEILMIDTHTGKPLPFGSLGVHKRSEFKDASVCLFVFDCLYYNGEVLTDKPIKHRKNILKQVMTEIPNHIVLSELEEIHDPDDLSNMIAKVLKLGLEGLVLKDLNSIYEPGKRHWLKVKKDYLFGGAMADSADLIVLGAWYGTGKKGGMMSVFLMGCYDKSTRKFCTVTKVHTGHDDKTLERLQDELDMDKISCDASKVPAWLKCTKTMVPDFVAKDPTKQPVWEITGAEFTQHEVHTADGISIRFPRVTKIRDDKDWETATSLQELKTLYKTSKEHTDVSLLTKPGSNDGGSSSNKNDAGAGTSHNTESNKGSKAQKRPSSCDLDSDPKKPKLESKKRQKTLTSFITGNTPNSNSTKKDLSELHFDNPLPDYFTDVKLLLEDGLRDQHPDLVRYFIAYGGTVLNSKYYYEATHVVHLQDSVSDYESIPCPIAAKHVTVDWLKSCIANETVQNSKYFSVMLRPGRS